MKKYSPFDYVNYIVGQSNKKPDNMSGFVLYVIYPVLAMRMDAMHAVSVVNSLPGLPEQKAFDMLCALVPKRKGKNNEWLPKKKKEDVKRAVYIDAVMEYYSLNKSAADELITLALNNADLEQIKDIVNEVCEFGRNKQI